MSSCEDRTPSDADFERSLLESARADTPTRGAAEAWASLCAAWAQVDVSGAASATGAQPSAADDERHVRPDEPARPTPLAGLDHGEARRGLSIRGASGWFLLGGLGGSLVTAIFLTSLHSSSAPESAGSAPAQPRLAPTVTTPSATSVAAGAEQPTAAPGSAVDEAPRSSSAVATDPSARHPAHTTSRSRAGGGVARVESELRPAALPAPTHTRELVASNRDAEPSTLAAEVSALEVARASFRAGWFARARRLIDNYHRDFPHSVFGPDAEEIAIEALAATRDEAELRARAEAFLARYPRDPHAGRVEQLLRQSSER